LSVWGLSVDADLMYRCMLMFGSQTSRQLERGLGLSRHRVARGLDELHAAGAVDRRPTHWAPVEPDGLISSLRRQRRSRHSAPIRDALPQPVPLDDGVRHLPSRALTRARLAELVGAVRHEHLAMQPERAYDAESARPAVPMDRALLTRGVRMRVLGAQPADGGDPLAAYGRQAEDLTPDYREAPEVPVKLIVMDRRIAFLPVSPDDLDRGYLEITQEAVVSAFVALFERRWEAAETRQEQPMPRISLTARERTLLGLLAQGYTDAGAADTMRISRRTVSNTLRYLMDRLGVDNRFQLGLAIGSLGVVTSTGPAPAGEEA
jgi:DNA-binding CsgD family transcriptional regulator